LARLGRAARKGAAVNERVTTDAVDPRLAFLARAAARHTLVVAGLMTLDEAFQGLITCLSCPCERETVDRWERLYPPRMNGRRRNGCSR